MPRSKRDNDQGATPDHPSRRTPDLDDLHRLDARPFARKRSTDAARDHQWPGTGESDTNTGTNVDVARAAGADADIDLPTDLHDQLHDNDFTDEDTFTDRDTEADVTGLTMGLPGGLASGLAGGFTGRDTMLDVTPRDTLLDLSAAARAASGTGAEPFTGERTLDDDEFPDEDTFDEPTGR